MRRTLTLLTTALAVALIAALTVIAVPAEGAPNGGGPGDPLLLSRVNQAGPMTVLKTNGGFRILAKNPKRPPLMIYTPDSMPPLDVSSTAKVANLNADLLDGLDSTAFVRDTNLLAAYAGGERTVDVDYIGDVVQSVTLDPGTDGTVVVNSTARILVQEAGHGVSCSIVTTDYPDSKYRQVWDSTGTSGLREGQLAGTRGFAVNARAPFTANLYCNLDGVDSDPIEFATIFNPAMTAIFIPNP
jgi:hypothetical protein